jgi:hypothetical protein
MSAVTRRAFLVTAPTGCLAVGAFALTPPPDETRTTAGTRGPANAGFPAQDPALVENVVLHAHTNLDAVRELIKDRPALAKASWDWGFGDWESALGAASHMGRRDMAELLIAHGARPNLFTFAMLDQIDAVRAIVQANPGLQRIHGPHGITLRAHARNGKAQRVLEYLDTVEGADVPQVNEPMSNEHRKSYLGSYTYGTRTGGTLTVVEMSDGQLGIRAGEGIPRHLFHLGDHTFHPTGAPSVRINFRVNEAGTTESLTIHDAELVLTARRTA